MHSIISEIRPEYFSDLNADDIPDSELSEGEEAKAAEPKPVKILNEVEAQEAEAMESNY